MLKQYGSVLFSEEKSTILNRTRRSQTFFPLDEVAGRAKLSWRFVVWYTSLNWQTYLLCLLHLISDPVGIMLYVVYNQELTMLYSIVWRTSAHWRPDQKQCWRGTQGEYYVFKLQGPWNFSFDLAPLFEDLSTPSFCVTQLLFCSIRWNV